MTITFLGIDIGPWPEAKRKSLAAFFSRVGYKETAQGRQRRRLFSGRGVDTDIIVASAKAYMQALNKLIDAATGEVDEDARAAVSEELVIQAGA